MGNLSELVVDQPILTKYNDPSQPMHSLHLFERWLQSSEMVTTMHEPCIEGGIQRRLVETP